MDTSCPSAWGRPPTSSASITAVTDLVCYGLTFWDFRPIVQGNAAIGWKLIQALVGRIRAAEAAG